MIRTAMRRWWPGLLALVCVLSLPQMRARADGPIPISTNSVFYYRFDVKVGPAAFCRPTGPWYSYFPVDPNLLAQPRAAAFPNWPNQYPPAGGIGYYPPPAAPYGYGQGVYPVSYQPQPMPGYWYGR